MEEVSTVLWVSSWKGRSKYIKKATYWSYDGVRDFSIEVFENRGQYLDLDCKG